MSQCLLLVITLGAWAGAIVTWLFAVRWFEVAWRYKIKIGFPDFIVGFSTIGTTAAMVFTMYLNMKPSNHILTIHECAKYAVIACR